MDKKAFLSRQRIGVILRTFARKEEDVPKRVEAVSNTVEAVLKLRNMFPIARVDVVVPSDDRYPDHDCGKTGPALQKALGDRALTKVHAGGRGDVFCGVLNQAVAKQSDDRIDWSLILSTEATSYVNPLTMDAIVDAASAGARAVGVAIDELEQSVLEGRLVNAFCMWHNMSLQSVGGFDHRASQVRTDDRLATYLRGWNAEQGEVYYPLHGVEEVIPLVKMVDIYGPCIAPILPLGEGVKRYEVPDEKTQPELYERYVKKMGTKELRQMAYLTQLGYDLSWLKGGVMEQYRHF